METGATHIIGTKNIGHDQSFCYLKDGAILYYCEEERFTRQKFGWGTSSYALEDLIARFHLDRDCDDVLFNTYDDMRAYRFQSLIEGHFDPKSNPEDAKRDYAEICMSRALSMAGFGFKNFQVTDTVEHHLLHAASGFFPSPFENAAILSLDGAGDGISTLIAEGIGNRIHIKHKIPLPHSLGNFYNLITIWLGLGGIGDEGKTMGASSYGDPKKYYDLFREKIIDYDDDGIFIVKAKNLAEYSAALKDVLGESPRNDPNHKISQRDFDVAATAQLIAEEILLRLARFAKKLTGQKYLCLAGGVALNSVANGKLLKSGLFEDIWIQPAAGDSGHSIGGALWNYYVTQDHPRRIENGEKNWWVQEHTYWGPEAKEEEIVDALCEFGLPLRKIKDVEAWTAQKIHENKVVGWFQGKIEAGPRALGNRSILANPTHPGMQDIVNNKVKFREAWRPFAPSVLEEECGRYFDSDHPSPFMILVYDVKEEWRAKLPAITHVDGTARVQTVSKKHNPRYYKLIDEFKKLSGIGVVLNTSFNLKGEPIVLTPRQAIVDFLRTQMDILVLHDYVLDKNDLAGFQTNRFGKDFTPAEDTFRFLKSGKYILVDYTHPEQNGATGHLIYQSSFHNTTFSVLPIAAPKEAYARFQKEFMNVTNVFENLRTSQGLSIPDLAYYRGLVCALPITPYLMGCRGQVDDIRSLLNLCEKFLGSHPSLDVWLLGPNGVPYEYRNFKNAVIHLEKDITQFAATMKELELQESDVYPFIEDLEKRFPCLQTPATSEENLKREAV